MKLTPSIIALCSASSLPREINEQCPSFQLDLLAACESDCERANVNCIKDCGNDGHCVSACTREFAACMDVCPCSNSCFDGCPCPYASKYCETCESTHVDEYELCSDKVHAELMSCINACPPFDTSCDHDCAVQSEIALQNCPCMDNCQGGCPCPNYSCSSDNVLHFVVAGANNDHTKRVTMNITPDPIVGYKFEAKLENKHDHRANSCSFFIRGRLYTVGGNAEEGEFNNTLRQVYTNVKTQTVITLADLPEPMNGANCAAYDSNHAMLCNISGNNRQKCYSALAPKGDPADLVFGQVANTHQSHFHGGMTHYAHHPVVFWGQNNGNTEMYDAETDKWNIIASNEEMKGAVWMSTVNFHNTIFAFGGSWQGVDGSMHDDIYRLVKAKNVFTWHKNERGLLHKRSQHTSITRENYIIHIGGDGKQDFEVMEKDGDHWTLRSALQINNFGMRPAAFWVQQDQFTVSEPAL